MSSLPATKPGKQILTRSMRVADILTILPEAEGVFATYGLHCSGCSIGGAEILEEAMQMHSMKEEDMNDLLADLHVMLARRPERPQTMTITDDAATALSNILATEGREGFVLQVGIDEAGGYSMEIVQKAGVDDVLFQKMDITVSASPITLTVIGGSTIDYRDGRFKLDVEGTAPGCACKNGGVCQCKEGPHSAEASRGKEGCGCA